MYKEEDDDWWVDEPLVLYCSWGDVYWTAMNYVWSTYLLHIIVTFRTCICSLEGHESTVWSIAFEPSGKRLGKCL